MTYLLCNQPQGCSVCLRTSQLLQISMRGADEIEANQRHPSTACPQQKLALQAIDRSWGCSCRNAGYPTA